MPTVNFRTNSNSIGTDSSLSKYYFEQGLTSLTNQEFYKALGNFNKVIEIDPGYNMVYAYWKIR